MKNRKALQDYNQFQSGWVSAVKYFVTDPGITILTAPVMHSQALSESKPDPWVAAQKDVSVICAHCDYMAGKVSLQLQSFSTFVFLMGKMILKYIIMHAVPPKQEECLGGSCILIPTVTTFHNIRHRPTKVSVQAAKNYK